MKVVVKAMVASIVVNLILVIIKFVVGVISNYKSLVADAIHSFSDVSTDIVAILGQWMASKKADDKHPYGHGKIEYITSLVIAGFILFLGINLIQSAFVEKLVEPKYHVIALAVVAITIILKYALAKYVHQKGKLINNNILLASSEENMADVLSSTGVFIAIILSMFSDYAPIFKYADKVGTVIISLFILKTGFNILRDNINAIIGESEQDEKVISNIERIIMSVSEVMAIDNLVVMKFGSYYQITLDASVDAKCSLSEAHEIAHQIEEKLLAGDLKIKYVIVHINPYEKKH